MMDTLTDDLSAYNTKIDLHISESKTWQRFTLCYAIDNEYLKEFSEEFVYILHINGL